MSTSPAVIVAQPLDHADGPVGRAVVYHDDLLADGDGPDPAEHLANQVFLVVDRDDDGEQRRRGGCRTPPAGHIRSAMTCSPIDAGLHHPVVTPIGSSKPVLSSTIRANRRVCQRLGDGTVPTLSLPRLQRGGPIGGRLLTPLERNPFWAAAWQVA